MAYVLQVQGFADGSKCPIRLQFLKGFNFEAHNGRGYGTFTFSLEQAMKFESIEAAEAFVNTVSNTRPVRPDGKPNKPLTATNWKVEEIVFCHGTRSSNVILH